MPQVERKHRINNEIRSRTVKVIIEKEDEDRPTIITVPFFKALQMATDEGLDLVQVSDGDPVTCKILDYNKYVYHMKKKTKHQELANRSQEDREIRLKPNVADHDLEVKAKKAREFLENGCKVKLQIKLKGREKYIKGIEESIINKFAELLKNEARLEQSGGSFILVPT